MLGAVKLLDEVVADFPLVSPAHRSAWFAALLTPLTRFALAGPLFLVEANTRGAGKGLILHAISHVLTGRPFPVTTYTADVDELRKRISAIAIESDLLTLFDHIDGRTGTRHSQRGNRPRRRDHVRLTEQGRKVLYPADQGRSQLPEAVEEVVRPVQG